MKRKNQQKKDYSVHGWELSLLPEIQFGFTESLRGPKTETIKRLNEKLRVPNGPNPKVSGESIETILKIIKKLQQY